MRLEFLNRDPESRRITTALSTRSPAFIVIYGRRRCGKSRLLQELLKQRDVYFLADQREAQLQREALAVEIERVLPGFSSAGFSSWESLFVTLNNTLKHPLTVAIDEFPYLVKSAPEISSTLQNILDRFPQRHFNLILSGSSQRMMQGLVLDAAEPLYGRAHEILKIRPLNAGWISEALHLPAMEAVEHYAVWGGVPRYWEMAAEYPNLNTAITQLVLDRDGLFHEEPLRLLLDDMRTATQSLSILSLVGGGCHRLSEIAGRLEKKAVNLARPLAQLIDLGYLRREVPFGESIKSTRRSLYKINDPFIHFYFRFVQANRSLLEFDLIEAVRRQIERDFPAYTALIWEELVRKSVPSANYFDIQWKPAQRWWGTLTDGHKAEIDIVAESLDGKALLVGEAKWRLVKDAGTLLNELKQKAQRLPFADRYRIFPGIWVKNRIEIPRLTCFTPDIVIDALR